MPERQEVSISSSQKDWGVDVAAMAGSLVHEIKNPLSTINLSAQLLQEEWKDASTPKEQSALRRLEVMSSEVQRVERHTLADRDEAADGLRPTPRRAKRDQLVHPEPRVLLALSLIHI